MYGLVKIGSGFIKCLSRLFKMIIIKQYEGETEFYGLPMKDSFLPLLYMRETHPIFGEALFTIEKKTRPVGTVFRVIFQ